MTNSVDALSSDWSFLSLYAFPPSKVIQEVLSKQPHQLAVFLLVAPFWPIQTWFWDLIPLLADRPRTLPLITKLLKQPGHTSIYDQSIGMRDLHVWPQVSDPLGEMLLPTSLWKRQFEERRLLLQRSTQTQQTFGGHTSRTSPSGSILTHYRCWLILVALVRTLDIATLFPVSAIGVWILLLICFTSNSLSTQVQL